MSSDEVLLNKQEKVDRSSTQIVDSTQCAAVQLQEVVQGCGYECNCPYMNQLNSIAPEGATHFGDCGHYFFIPTMGHEDGTWELWEGGEWVTTEATSDLPGYRLSPN